MYKLFSKFDYFIGHTSTNIYPLVYRTVDYLQWFILLNYTVYILKDSRLKTECKEALNP